MGAARVSLDQLELLGVDREVLARAGPADDGEFPRALVSRWAGERLPCAGRAELRCMSCGTGGVLRFRCAGRCGRVCVHDERAATSLLRAIPRVPVRHWVLTLPQGLRAASADDQRLVAELCRVFVGEVLAFVRARCGALERGPVQGGAVSLVHRVGQLFDLKVHVHALVLDGVYHGGTRGAAPTFVPMLDEPEPDALLAVTRAVRERLVARWGSKRHADANGAIDRLAIATALAQGPEAATAVRRLQVERVEQLDDTPPLRVGVGARRDGFGVHAMERIAPDARVALDRLARYLLRAPVALARLRPGGAGKVVQRLAHPFADGTTHVEFSADELARRLVALTPARRIHRVSYHGALAPQAAAKWRARPLQLVLLPDEAPPRKRARAGERSRWPAPECSGCGGPLRVVAIEEHADPALFEPAPAKRRAGAKR
jgi:Putative transposase